MIERQPLLYEAKKEQLERCRQATTLEDLLWGWGVSYDRANDPPRESVRLIFEAEEEKDNQLLFDTLAPFVELGSWVGLRDDHGAQSV
jgi:hypothetical protein